MSKIENLIQQYCPDGVEYKHLWEITYWDKKFNAVDNHKQPKVIKYHYFLANDLKPLIVENGNVKILTTSTSNLYTTEELAEGFISEGEIVSIPWGGNPNIQYYKGKFITGDNRIATAADLDKLNNKYLYYCLKNKQEEIGSFYRGAGIKHPSMSKVLDLQIPLPPLPVQEEIVRILDHFTQLEAELEAELDCRKRQYEYYRDKLLRNEEWKTVRLGEIGKVCMCKRIMKDQTSKSGDVPFYKIGTFGKEADAFISKSLFEEYKNKYSYPKAGDILISCSGTIGKTVIFNGEDSYFQDSNIVWISNDETKVLNKYLFYAYQLNPFKISTGGTISRLYNEGIENAVIPLPPLAEQERIVSILDRFDTLVNDISQGLPAEIEARNQQYEYYRDKLLTFKRKEA